jgi:hypothetical protein
MFFNLFKTRDKDDIPNELISYCKKRRMPGFELLTWVATCSSGLATLNQTGFRQDIFEECFAYLLGKACWIAETNRRFSEMEYQIVFGNLPHVDAAEFSKDGISRLVLARMQKFFTAQEDSHGFILNKLRVGQYCGGFISEIGSARFNEIVISAFRETGWNGMQWRGISLSQHELTRVLENAFNFRMSLPSDLYEKSDYTPAVEAFYDLAFVAILREKYLQEDVLWWASSSGGMFEVVFLSLLDASNLVRQFVISSTFPVGLRS